MLMHELMYPIKCCSKDICNGILVLNLNSQCNKIVYWKQGHNLSICSKSAFKSTERLLLISQCKSFPAVSDKHKYGL